MFELKKWVLILSVIFAVISGYSQNLVESAAYNTTLKALLTHSVDEIGVNELLSCIEDVILIDAREIEEYEVSHLPDAIHVGYESFDSTRVLDLSRSSSVVVYCSIGYRSEKVSEQLMDMGFSDVMNLYGGIFEWVNQGNPVYDELGKTNKVHAYNRTWGIWLNEGVKVYD